MIYAPVCRQITYDIDDDYEDDPVNNNE